MAQTTNTTSAFAEVIMHHATRAKADRLAATLAAEYPALTLEAVTDDGALASWEVTAEGDTILATEDRQVPDLADILDAAAEAGIDPVGEEDEEPKLSGSVVGEKYRQIYREVSTTGTTNGDWLAETLTGWTTNAAGQLNTDALADIFAANGIDLTASWATNRSRGWQGRFRMSGRIVLEKIVAQTGVLYHLPDTKAIVVPEDFLATLRAKHAKWLAKEAKAAAKAEAAIREAVEGA